MTFDIKKHVTENNDTLNEAPASLAAAGSLQWVTEHLQKAEIALHKARQSSRKHTPDQALDKTYSTVVNAVRNARLLAERLERMEKQGRK